MIVSHAHVRTRRATLYLRRLSNNLDCAARPQTRATILFPVGRCELAADNGYLDIEISANSLSNASLIEDAISDRLEALAIDEELRFQWIVAPPERTSIAGTRLYAR
jgi:hypothetical protein